MEASSCLWARLLTTVFSSVLLPAVLIWARAYSPSLTLKVRLDLVAGFEMYSLLVKTFAVLPLCEVSMTIGPDCRTVYVPACKLVWRTVKSKGIFTFQD